ncbi:MAG: PKD domain-containing protein [Planctomycetes bacterium]|nr:PKD domain-containing protein [Planctomycetota bacterium]
MMKQSLRLAVAAGLSALVTAGALSDVSVVGDKAPSTQTTPYVIPVAAGVRTVSILTVGDTVNPKLDGATPYRMIGLPDGLGAFDNGDGTFTLLAGHEMGSTAGTARAHGSIGASVSATVVDRATLAVKSVNDLVRTVMNWDAATQKWVAGTTVFNRFCSADLAAPTAFFDPATGKGTRERLFLNGEETTGGRAFAHIATGTNAGVSVELARLGKDAFENVVANPFPQTKTVVVCTDDTTPGQVYIYVGTKLAAGTEVQRAGLANGKLFGVIANGTRLEDRTTGVGIAKGQSARFTLADLGDQSGVGVNTQALAAAANVTEFLRPEDGAWDPANPKDFYFVTTDRFDQVKNATGAQVGRSRLWRLRLDDVAAPEGGGSITMLLDGSEPHQMFDNLCVDGAGHLLLQEDPGNVSHTARIWQYDFAGGALTEIAKFDPARFGDVGVAATAPFSQDEESSGIIDASAILGPGWFLFDAQAHYAIGDTELVEGGQLLALYNPASAVAPSVTVAPTALPAVTFPGVPVAFSAQGGVTGGGPVTYAWNFGDGAQGTGAVTTHAYKAPGTFQAQVTVTHAATGKTAQATTQVVIERPMSASTLQVALNLASAGKDALVLKGALPIDAEFDATGKAVSIDVGGVQRTFTLDARGRGTASDGSIQLVVKKVRGAVLAQRAAFTVTLKNATLAASLADDGLGNETVSGKAVSVGVRVTFDGTTFDSAADLIYDATAGKKGIAK